MAGNFFPTAHALIGYFEVTWHLRWSCFPPNSLSGQHCKNLSSVHSALLPANVDRRPPSQRGLMNFQLYNKLLKDRFLWKQFILFPVNLNVSEADSEPVIKRLFLLFSVAPVLQGYEHELVFGVQDRQREIKCITERSNPPATFKWLYQPLNCIFSSSSCPKPTSNWFNLTDFGDIKNRSDNMSVLLLPGYLKNMYFKCIAENPVTRAKASKQYQFMRQTGKYTVPCSCTRNIIFTNEVSIGRQAQKGLRRFARGIFVSYYLAVEYSL